MAAMRTTDSVDSTLISCSPMTTSDINKGTGSNSDSLRISSGVSCDANVLPKSVTIDSTILHDQSGSISYLDRSNLNVAALLRPPLYPCRPVQMIWNSKINSDSAQENIIAQPSAAIRPPGILPPTTEKADKLLSRGDMKRKDMEMGSDDENQVMKRRSASVDAADGIRAGEATGPPNDSRRRNSFVDNVPAESKVSNSLHWLARVILHHEGWQWQGNY